MVMEDEVYEFATRTRLLQLPSGLPAHGSECPTCHYTVHDFDAHFLNCKKASSQGASPRAPITFGHNCITNVLGDFSQVPLFEQIHEKIDSKSVPKEIIKTDMEADGQHGNRVATDVTVANLSCDTALSSADYLEVRAKAKTRKYQITLRRAHMEFIPFVVSSSGKWHKSAEKLFKKLSTRSVYRKGLARLYIATIIQQRNYYALIRYKNSLSDAYSGVVDADLLPGLPVTVGELVF
jgi:hypothetical protein